MGQTWPPTCSTALSLFFMAWNWATAASMPASTVTLGTCATRSSYMWAVSVAPNPSSDCLPSPPATLKRIVSEA